MEDTEKSRETSKDMERQESPELKPEATGPPKHNFPEGGRRAWLAVLGCWCAMFFTFGYLNAFGYVLVFEHLSLRSRLTSILQYLRDLLYYRTFATSYPFTNRLDRINSILCPVHGRTVFWTY
jgi:hypothetical protein